MKTTLTIILGLIFSLQICFGDAKQKFIEKVRKAHEAGSVETFVQLHYGGIPEEMKPMITRRWNHEVKKGTLSNLSIRPFKNEDTERHNQEIVVQETSYIRTAPAIAFIVFTYEKQSASVPISLVDGVYYLSSIKKK